MRGLFHENILKIVSTGRDALPALRRLTVTPLAIEGSGMLLRCKINGEPVEMDVSPRLLLSDFIRHEMKLTGTHVGCEMGVCGACTVIVDGAPVRSCLMFAVQADHCEVRTVESLATDGQLSSLQVAFSRHHALQCGFCTPGVLMTLQAARERNVWPQTDADARDLLGGNLCRCTGYQGVVDLILEQPS